jgi:hypothetical protein
MRTARTSCLAIVALAGAAGLGLTDRCLADTINLGGGENYALLFQGGGGNTLHVTNVTLGGNIGVAGTGNFQDAGPSTVSGRVDFADTVTSRFSSSNAANTYNGGQHSPPYVGNFGVGPVQSAMNYLNALSQTLMGDAGTPVAINGIQTLNASSGALFNINGQNIHVFDATSFNNSGATDVLTINGTANDLVAINLDGLGNIQMHGGIVLTGGIGLDNVVFNIGGGNYATHSGGVSFDINNNQGNHGIARGIFLNPNGAVSVSDCLAEGRVFGGDSHDEQYVSGAHLNAPSGIPLPTAAGLALAGFGIVGVRRRRA